jgi:2-hydroxychromene-2-carboxylate isomerase
MHITHFFTPMSGFAYLGMGALCALAQRHGVEVVHRPVHIGKVFAAVEATPPPLQSAARLKWRRTDMMRWARHRDLPLREQPKHWPVNADSAACMIIAAQQMGLDGTALASSLLSAVWARDLDISAPQVLTGLADELGLMGKELMQRTATLEVQQIYEANTADAIAAGVIGSPTYLYGEEFFFGQDRLAFLEEALSHHSAA